MSHHSTEEMPAGLRELMGSPYTGPTNQFPRGKLTEEDAGEIMVAVAADHKNQVVLVDFGKPVAWIGFTAKQASELADLFQKKAWELRGIEAK